MPLNILVFKNILLNLALASGFCYAAVPSIPLSCELDTVSTNPLSAVGQDQIMLPATAEDKIREFLSNPLLPNRTAECTGPEMPLVTETNNAMFPILYPRQNIAYSPTFISGEVGAVESHQLMNGLSTAICQLCEYINLETSIDMCVNKIVKRVVGWHSNERHKSSQQSQAQVNIDIEGMQTDPNYALHWSARIIQPFVIDDLCNKFFLPQFRKHLAALLSSEDKNRYHHLMVMTNSLANIGLNYIELAPEYAESAKDPNNPNSSLVTLKTSFRQLFLFDLDKDFLDQHCPSITSIRISRASGSMVSYWRIVRQSDENNEGSENIKDRLSANLSANILLELIYMIKIYYGRSIEELK